VAAGQPQAALVNIRAARVGPLLPSWCAAQIAAGHLRAQATVGWLVISWGPVWSRLATVALNCYSGFKYLEQPSLKKIAPKSHEFMRSLTYNKNNSGHTLSFKNLLYNKKRNLSTSISLIYRPY
jgi:hypothetical protein